MSPRDPETIAREAEGLAVQIGAQMRRMLDMHAAWSRLFLGDDGQLKPEARRFFAELAGEGFLSKSTFDPDARIHAKNEGRREIALWILRGLKLDNARLGRLAAMAKENGDDD